VQSASVPFRHDSAAIENAADRETGHVALHIGVPRGDGVNRRGRPGSRQLSGWNNHYRPVKHVGLFADAGQHVRPIATRAPNEPLDPHGITRIRLTIAVLSTCRSGQTAAVTARQGKPGLAADGE